MMQVEVKTFIDQFEANAIRNGQYRDKLDKSALAFLEKVWDRLSNMILMGSLQNILGGILKTAIDSQILCTYEAEFDWLSKLTTIPHMRGISRREISAII